MRSPSHSRYHFLTVPHRDAVLSTVTSPTEPIIPPLSSQNLEFIELHSAYESPLGGFPHAPRRILPRLTLLASLLAVSAVIFSHQMWPYPAQRKSLLTPPSSRRRPTQTHILTQHLHPYPHQSPLPHLMPLLCRLNPGSLCHTPPADSRLSSASRTSQLDPTSSHLNFFPHNLS
ncbi:hypothetical protein BJV78DRAFT_625185 [Lactifluus subvellereus]|nr:hypothetical protein BJV78DRAFT_625185 [Lactifluus subvellereus]